VRLISADGKQLGILSIESALFEAEKVFLDLVEISPKANPPVCKLMDYGKFRYQQGKKVHSARKNQKIISLKEIKIRPKIEEHDFQFKLRNATRFLKEGNKVKVIVMFSGRQITHKESGISLLKNFIESLKDLSILEHPIKDEGRSLFIILAPPKKEKGKK